jgi:hypothetical protein
MPEEEKIEEEQEYLIARVSEPPSEGVTSKRQRINLEEVNRIS